MRPPRIAPLLAVVLLAGCGGAGSAGPVAPPAGVAGPVQATPAGDAGGAHGSEALGGAVFHGRPLCALPEGAGTPTFVLPSTGDDGIASGSCADVDLGASRTGDASGPANAATAGPRAASR